MAGLMTPGRGTGENEPGDTREVVVVLGAAVWEGGRPSPSLLRRALHGVQLVNLGRARVMIASGAVGKHPPSEAAVIRTIALERGLSADRLLLDEQSRNTMESAIACTRAMRTNGWHSAWVVTDSYHLLRAVTLFWLAGARVSGSAPDRRGTGTARGRWYFLHARELVALPWNVLKVLLWRLARKGGPTG